jgi:hypothetical protein
VSTPNDTGGFEHSHVNRCDWSVIPRRSHTFCQTWLKRHHEPVNHPQRGRIPCSSHSRGEFVHRLHRPEIRYLFVQVSPQLLDRVQPRCVRRSVVDEHNLFARDVVLALVRSVRPRSVLHVDDVVGGSTVLNHFRADQPQSVMFAQLGLSNALIRRRRAEAV